MKRDEARIIVLEEIEKRAALLKKEVLTVREYAALCRHNKTSIYRAIERHELIASVREGDEKEVLYLLLSFRRNLIYLYEAFQSEMGKLKAWDGQRKDGSIIYNKNYLYFQSQLEQPVKAMIRNIPMGNL